MSKERIAGRALDAEIAERVFGCIVTTEYPATIGRIPVCGCGDGNWHGWRACSVPHFSTEIAAAFLIVEAMRAKGWQKYELRNDGNQHIACFWQDFHRDERVTRIADSLPLAICLASLAALDADASEKAPLKDSLSAPLPDTPRE